jgi:hypothetical protein
MEKILLNLLKTILKKQNELLNDHMSCQPGGKTFLEAKDDFLKLSNNR